MYTEHHKKFQPPPYNKMVALFNLVPGQVCRTFWTRSPVVMPKSLLKDHNEFVQTDDTQAMLLDLFDFGPRHKTAHCTVKHVADIIKNEGITSVSKQKYGKWFAARGAAKVKVGGQWVWQGMQSMTLSRSEACEEDRPGKRSCTGWQG